MAAEIDLITALDEKLGFQSTPPSSTALSNKATSVLSQSYADSEIRDALHTLDQKHTKNTAETRRNLRLDVQSELIRRNSEIIRNFGAVAQQLKHVGNTIQTLSQHHQDIRRHVTAAHQENAPALEEASTLLAQKQELQQKQQLLDAFTKHFILSEQDLLILTSTTTPIDDTFFAVLKRMKQTQSDCQILLGTESQRLGLELTEQSLRQLDAGYQKLHSWTQREFKNLNFENPQINSVIRRAVRALAERPALFQSTLNSFAEAREHVLTDAFYAALTGSSAGDTQTPMTKPIEFHGHDPLRYVGDMLAWTHSTTVSEKEALEILFIAEGDEIKRGYNAGREAEPWSASNDDEFDGEKALGDLVNRTTVGVAKGLRQRVEQALQNSEDAVMLYRISNLVKFYMTTFTKLLGPKSNILTALDELKDSSVRYFHNVISETVASVQSELGPPSGDLSIPIFLDEALSQFQALLKSYDSSFTMAAAGDTDFEPIVARALDPFLTVCEKMSEQLSEPQAGVFAINCLLATKSTLLPYTLFTQPKVEKLETKLSPLMTSLTEYQHAFFVHTSGLHPLLTVISQHQQQQIPSLSEEQVDKLASAAQLQPHALSDASATLDEFLPSALMDAMENLRGLSQRDVAGNVTAEAADRFCEDFELVEGALARIDQVRLGSDDTGDEGEDDDEDEDEDEEVGSGRRPRDKVEQDGSDGVSAREGRAGGQVPRLRDLFPRTSGEIRVLLS